MSSSTSSSSAGEWRVVLFLAISLLVAEAVVRRFEPLLSRDLAHIRSMPATAEKMRQHAGEKVLVLGNSLSRQAVDPDILATGLMAAAGGKSPAVFWCVPDGTNMTNWDYCLDRYFLHAGAIPGRILIGTGPLHLRDSRGDASRLAAYHVDAQDFRRAWNEDLRSWEERCEFLLSRASRVHATRHRIKPHVFGALVPHYFEVEQLINTRRDAARLRLGKGVPEAETHHHLAHLLEACRQHGVKVALFSVPLPEPYKVSEAAVRLIQESGASWLPLADTPGITPDHFPDGYHLNAAGAQVFTRHLVRAMDAIP